MSIYLNSAHHASQEINDLIQEKEVNHDSGDMYADYKPTQMQFKIDVKSEEKDQQVFIPYNNRLTDLDAKYSIVCKYENKEDKWVQVKHKNEKDLKQVSFYLNGSGYYGIFKNHYWYE